MQPTATTAWADPLVLRSEASSSVSTESFLAASTKPQVFTMTVSASSGSSTRRKPPASRRPASSSESTSLRAQPSVTSATVVRGASVSGIAVITVTEYDGPAAGSANRSPPRVAALRPTHLAVPQADLDLSGLGEVLEIPPGGDPGDAQQAG